MPIDSQLSHEVSEWSRHFSIEKDIMNQLTSAGFNTLPVLALIDASDLQEIGITGVGYRKKVLHASQQLQTGAWKPTAGETPTTPFRAPGTRFIRCTRCHRYREAGRGRHPCTESERCVALETCPTRFHDGHSEERKNRRKESAMKRAQILDRQDRFLEEELAKEQARMAARSGNNLESSNSSLSVASEDVTVASAPSPPAPPPSVAPPQPPSVPSPDKWVVLPNGLIGIVKNEPT